MLFVIEQKNWYKYHEQQVLSFASIGNVFKLYSRTFPIMFRNILISNQLLFSIPCSLYISFIFFDSLAGENDSSIW